MANSPFRTPESGQESPFKCAALESPCKTALAGGSASPTVTRIGVFAWRNISGFNAFSADLSHFLASPTPAQVVTHFNAKLQLYHTRSDSNNYYATTSGSWTYGDFNTLSITGGMNGEDPRDTAYICAAVGNWTYDWGTFSATLSGLNFTTIETWFANGDTPQSSETWAYTATTYDDTQSWNGNHAHSELSGQIDVGSKLNGIISDVLGYSWSWAGNSAFTYDDFSRSVTDTSGISPQPTGAIVDKAGDLNAGPGTVLLADAYGSAGAGYWWEGGGGGVSLAVMRMFAKHDSVIPQSYFVVEIRGCAVNENQSGILYPTEYRLKSVGGWLQPNQVIGPNPGGSNNIDLAFPAVSLPLPNLASGYPANFIANKVVIGQDPQQWATANGITFVS